MRDTIVELDSYRLARYAVQVPCFVCEEGNAFDAEFCRHCQAPMALAHQANSQKLRPRMIAMIGPSGVGKTVCLGMLIDMLSRQSAGMQLLARGAFSITLQQTTVAALSRCELPTKTPNEPDRWNWVHAQVRAPRQKHPVELIMPDMAGEAILEEVDHPRTYPVIRSFLSKCAGILLLVDTPRLRAGSHEQGYFAMKLLSYLAELDDDPKRGWPSRPVGLVFSKADQCEECFDNPTEFARVHAPGVAQLCTERFPTHRFFACGVAGACAQRLIGGTVRQRVPLRVEPRGLIEPFEWLVERLRA